MNQVNKKINLDICDINLISFIDENYVINFYFQDGYIPPLNDIQVKFLVSDLDLNITYYSEIKNLSSFNGMWAQPLSLTLFDKLKETKKFPGYKISLYYNNILIYDAKLMVNDIIQNNFVKLDSDMNDTVGASYIEFEYTTILDKLNIKGNIIDAGANIGIFTLCCLNKKYNDILSIHCIEPNPDVYKYLSNNFKSVEKVKTYEKAVYTTNDEIKTFYVNKNNSVAGTMDNLHDFQAAFQVKTINIRKLFEYVDYIDLLKLDIEGAEYLVIEQLDDYCYERISQFFIEFHMHNNPNLLINKLTQKGFNCEYVNSNETNKSGFIIANK